MTDFWFNHFNIFINKGPDRYLTTAYERDVIRPHAMGKFKDLLIATAKSPAMLLVSRQLGQYRTRLAIRRLRP